MELMVVDRSGRGHALADAVARTRSGVRVHYVPGCDDLGHPRITSEQQLKVTDHSGLVDYARRHRIDLVVVSNAIALAEGVVDSFRSAGFPVVGPDRQAARLESSKVFAKTLFGRYAVPTPDHRAFDDPAQACAFLRANPAFRVVKADGLCGGNGAFVCETLEQAEVAVDRLMRQRVFGAAGERVVVERRIHGRELSFFVIVDSGGWLTLPMAVDYPKSDDWNRGPISGGMGALSHHPLDTPELSRQIETRLLTPLRQLIAAEGLNYTGFLYLGVMLCDEGPVLLETNARMGDPEAEVILPRVESDLTAVWEATLRGRVSDCQLRFADEHLCNVVATQGPVRATDATAGLMPGWPFGRTATGQHVSGVERIDRSRAHVFIGDARRDADGTLLSDGGRVVHVVGRGVTGEEARRNAYEGIGHVWFDGMRYRHDIGCVMPWEDLEAVP